ncbi:MAG TPA: hypothetical protein VFB58_07870 [Chloroflexota bacterium]|nr:hypothetical protein [Chloroflexota bacterium]
MLKRGIVAVFLLLPLVPGAVRAQSSVPASFYLTGWNMVGAPPGTDFSSAAALFTYQNGAYVTSSSRTTALCGGYWAYFNANTLVPLATPPTAASMTCPLQAGWTMVGNPFDAPATVPAGTTAWYWNPAIGQYQTVSQIPQGGSVWIYSTSGGSVTLAAVPSPPAAQTLIINTQSPLSSYQTHVGMQVEVLVAPTVPSTVAVDSNYLQFTGSGITGDITCVNGTASCAPGTYYSYWMYTAARAGTTLITVNPLCLQATPPCGVPSRAIQLIILP